MKTVTGEYEAGYSVLVNGREVYAGGNNPQESQTVWPAPPCSLPPLKVGLRTVRRWCISTAKGIARERSANFAGVERVECVLDL
ncbi:MAG TPA: hypothetical protein VGR14_03740 [Verrucomicrobiae bacterium]|jgi:hypothetical protein|nr:hypothetical protein [Verrucomicrobiae bacterium]